MKQRIPRWSEKIIKTLGMLQVDNNSSDVLTKFERYYVAENQIRG